MSSKKTKQTNKKKTLACNRKEAETVKQVESDGEAVLLENWFPELLNLMISVTLSFFAMKVKIPFVCLFKLFDIGFQ